MLWIHVDTHNWTTEGKQPSEKWVKSELAPKDGQLTREHLERPSTSQAIRDCMLKGSWGTTAQLEWLEPRSQHTRSWTWRRAKGVFCSLLGGAAKGSTTCRRLNTSAWRWRWTSCWMEPRLWGKDSGPHRDLTGACVRRVHWRFPPQCWYFAYRIFTVRNTILWHSAYCTEHSSDTTCIVRNTLLWLSVYCTQHTPPTECLVYGTHSSDRVSIVWKTFL